MFRGADLRRAVLRLAPRVAAVPAFSPLQSPRKWPARFRGTAASRLLQAHTCFACVQRSKAGGRGPGRGGPAGGAAARCRAGRSRLGTGPGAASGPDPLDRLAAFFLLGIFVRVSHVCARFVLFQSLLFSPIPRLCLCLCVSCRSTEVPLNRNRVLFCVSPPDEVRLQET